MAKGNILILSVSIVVFIATLFLLLIVINDYKAYNIFGEQELYTLDDYILPKAVSCTEYNIAAEYRNAYDDATINAMENGCNAVLGTYTENYQELSCYWNSDIFYMSCSNPALVEFGRFCNNELKGYYTCDGSIAYFGCQCNRPAPDKWVSDEPDDDDGYDWNENETYEELTLCSDVLLPQYGDLGGICRDEGWCLDDAYSCEHYWDYNNKEHKCGCSESYFCGQYCFEYYYTTQCDCPLGSYREIVTRSTFQCVPEGCECGDTEIIC